MSASTYLSVDNRHCFSSFILYEWWFKVSASTYLSVGIGYLVLFSMDNNNKDVCKHLSVDIDSLVWFSMNNKNKDVCKHLSTCRLCFSSFIIYG